MSENYLSEEAKLRAENARLKAELAQQRSVNADYVHIIKEHQQRLATIRNDTIEQCAKACEETKDESGENDSGATWLRRATKHDCAAAIRLLRQTQEPT